MFVCICVSPAFRIVNETSTEARLAPGCSSLTPAQFLVLVSSSPGTKKTGHALINCFNEAIIKYGEFVGWTACSLHLHTCGNSSVVKATSVSGERQTSQNESEAIRSLAVLLAKGKAAAHQNFPEIDIQT